MTPSAVSFNPDGLRRSGTAFAPWTIDALLRVAGMNAVGFVLVALSWFQISDQATVQDQLGWLNLGIIGVGVCAAANALWLLRGRRTIGLARRVLWPMADATAPPVSSSSPVSGGLRWVSGTTRVHRSGCALLTGRTDSRVTEAHAAREGLLRCEVCEP